MEIGIVLVEALVAGAVASLIYFLIVGPWSWRNFVGLWLALSLIAWVGLAGPLKLG
jgi:hypothetical protein